MYFLVPVPSVDKEAGDDGCGQGELIIPRWDLPAGSMTGSILLLPLIPSLHNLLLLSHKI